MRLNPTRRKSFLLLLSRILFAITKSWLLKIFQRIPWSICIQILIKIMPLENITPGQRKVRGGCVLLLSLSKGFLETGFNHTHYPYLPTNARCQHKPHPCCVINPLSFELVKAGFEKNGINTAQLKHDTLFGLIQLVGKSKWFLILGVLEKLVSGLMYLLHYYFFYMVWGKR